MQRREAIVFGCARICTLRKKNIDSANLTPGRRTVQRCFACGVLGVYVSASREQLGYSLHVAGPRRRVKLRFGRSICGFSRDKRIAHGG